MFSEKDKMMFNFQNKSTGGELLDAVCSQLELQDVDYFGLKYERRGDLLWLDLNKKLSKSFRSKYCNSSVVVWWYTQS